MFDFKTAAITTYNKQCCATLEDNKLFQRAKVNCGDEKAKSIIEGHRRNTTAGHNILITTSSKATTESEC